MIFSPRRLRDSVHFVRFADRWLCFSRVTSPRRLRGCAFFRACGCALHVAESRGSAYIGLVVIVNAVLSKLGVVA